MAETPSLRTEIESRAASPFKPASPDGLAPPDSNSKPIRRRLTVRRATIAKPKTTAHETTQSPKKIKIKTCLKHIPRTSFNSPSPGSIEEEWQEGSAVFLSSKAGRSFGNKTLLTPRTSTSGEVLTRSIVGTSKHFEAHVPRKHFNFDTIGSAFTNTRSSAPDYRHHADSSTFSRPNKG